MATFLFGVDFWAAKVFGNFQVWFLMSIFTMSASLWVIINFWRTFRKGGIGKNGSTVAGTSIISPIIPLLLVIIPAFIISEKSRSGLFIKHPVLYLMTFGLLGAKVSCRLVVAHMSKSDMSVFDHGLWGPAALFINQYFSEFLPEYFVLWMAFIWCSMDLVLYCSQVCLEMCRHLNILLFKIPYPPKINKSTSIRK